MTAVTFEAFWNRGLNEPGGRRRISWALSGDLSRLPSLGVSSSETYIEPPHPAHIQRDIVTMLRRRPRPGAWPWQRYSRHLLPHRKARDPEVRARA